MRRKRPTRAAAACLLAALPALGAGGRGTGPEPWMQLADPAGAGWSSAGLAAAHARAAELGTAAFLLVERGVVVAAWGDVARPRDCGALRGALVSALCGALVDEGRIDPGADLAELALDDLGGLDARQRAATVGDLLRARSRVLHPAALEPEADRALRAAGAGGAPGGQPHDDAWGRNALVTIVERAADADLEAVFQARLALPLGMEDLEPGVVRLVREPSRSRHAAAAFCLSARDLARFGALYARGGRWGGRAVLPADWILESTTAQPAPQDAAGRGFRWWVQAGRPESADPLARHDRFWAHDRGGDLLLVVPALELVLVHRADPARPVAPPDARALCGLALAARAEEPSAARALTALAAAPLPGAPRPAAPPGPVPAALAARLVGEYLLEGGGRLRLHAAGGRLYAFLPDEDRESELLLADGDARLVAPWAERGLELELEAQPGPQGVLSGSRAGAPLRARRAAD